MQTEQRNDTIEIDLKELFFELLGHWRIILLSTVLVGMIAFMYSKFLVTPQYESTAELYVLSKSTSITSLTDLQIGTNLTTDYLEVVVERPVLEQVIENLDLDETYYTLKSKVTVTNPSDTRFLQITVTDEDNDRAKLIADELANVVRAFISEKMGQDQPTVISWGYADWNPVSPNTTRNTAMGALLGFLLAAAIIVIAYLLNDSIMTTEDLENKVHINVLGTLPLDDNEGDDPEETTSSRRGKKALRKA